MPFESKAQQRFMFKKHPKIAKRWAGKYGVSKDLPERKGGKSKKDDALKRFSRRAEGGNLKHGRRSIRRRQRFRK